MRKSQPESKINKTATPTGLSINPSTNQKQAMAVKSRNFDTTTNQKAAFNSHKTSTGRVNIDSSSTSHDSGVASTSVPSHRGSMCHTDNDEDMMQYSAFAAGLKTDHSATSARAIVKPVTSRLRGGASSSSAALIDTESFSKGGATSMIDAKPSAKVASSSTVMTPPSMGVASSIIDMAPPSVSEDSSVQAGVGVKHTMKPSMSDNCLLGAAVENAAYSPTLGKRNCRSGYGAMLPLPPIHTGQGHVPHKRLRIDTRPDPYSAAKQATAVRLSERSKRVKQLNSDLDSSSNSTASPATTDGSINTINQSINTTATNDSSRDTATTSENTSCSNLELESLDAADSQIKTAKMRVKRVQFKVVEKPGRARRRYLSVRYRSRNTSTDILHHAPPTIAGRFSLGVNSTPTSQPTTLTSNPSNDPHPYPHPRIRRRGSIDHVVVRRSRLQGQGQGQGEGVRDTTMDTLLDQSEQEILRQPPSLDAQPKKSILRLNSQDHQSNNSRLSIIHQRTLSADSESGSVCSFASSSDVIVLQATTVTSTIIAKIVEEETVLLMETTAVAEVTAVNNNPPPTRIRRPSTKYTKVKDATVTDDVTTVSRITSRPSVVTDV